MTDKVFAYDPSGKAVEIQPHQQEAAANNSGFQAISQEQAQRANRAEQAAERVDQKFGTVGKALAGFGNGLTLGGGGALATATGAIDRPDMEALQETGAFQAGDIAGMLAPALFTGGEAVAARGAIAGTEVAERGILARALGWTPAGLMNAAGGQAERLAGRVLPEMSGLLGKVARPTLQMATRGATEGAIVNMAHTTSDGVIHNKPLTAQALAASGVDGALFGGLAGGILGGAGALAGAGVDAVGSSALGRVAGKGDISASIALKRMGATGEDLAGFEAAEGGLQGALRNHYDVIAKGGESLKSSTSAIAKSVKETEKHYAATAASVIETADHEAAALVPNVERMEARIQQDLATKFGGTVKENDVTKAFKGLSKDFDPLAGVEPKAGFAGVAPEPPKPYGELPPVAPSGPGPAPRMRVLGDEYEKASNRYRFVEKPEYENALAKHKEAAEAHTLAEKTRFAEETAAFKAAKKLYDDIPDMVRNGKGNTWKAWADSRKQLADMVETARGGPTEQVYRTALNAMDNEFSTALNTAMETIGKKDLATQYASAKAGEALAKQTGKMVSTKMASELGGAEAPIGPRDVGTFVGMSAIGHPLSGAAFVSAKGLGKIFQRRVEPAIAEAAYRMSMGAQAAGATVTIGNRISSAMRTFINSGTKAASGYRALSSPTVKYDVKSFSKTIELADKLTDAAHQAKVQEMAQALTEAGHPELAAEMVATNQRATEYINHNRVKDPKTRAAGSLTRPAAETGMSNQGWRFMRQIRAIREPLSVLDDMHSGTLSRDAVNAFKYVYPDLHTEIVSHMANQLMAMKQAGKFISSDKLNTLATMAGAAMDPKQDKPFLNAIQSGIASHKQATGNQPGQGHSGGSGAPPQAAYQTPLQSALG